MRRILRRVTRWAMLCFGQSQLPKPLDREIEPDDAARLWDEYKYRHQHCWRVVIQLTAAAVILAVLPYAQPTLIDWLKWRVIIVPLLGIALTVFGFLMMMSELSRLDVVRYRYETHQEKKLEMPFHPSGFTRRVHVYLLILVLLEVLNFAILVFCPAV